MLARFSRIAGYHKTYQAKVREDQLHELIGTLDLEENLPR